MTAKRILLVDDDPSSLLLGAVVFARAGFHVRTATSAEEALEAAGESELDVILMDVGLPGMNGLTAIETLRHDPRHDGVVVLCLTADPARHARTALRSGAAGCLGKPYNIHRITHEVMSYCGQS